MNLNFFKKWQKTFPLIYQTRGVFPTMNNVLILNVVVLQSVHRANDIQSSIRIVTPLFLEVNLCVKVSVGGVMVKGNEEWHCAKKPTGEITFEQKPFTTGEEPLAPPRNTTSRMCFTDYGNGVKVFSFNRVWVSGLCQPKRFQQRVRRMHEGFLD